MTCSCFEIGTRARPTMEYVFVLKKCCKLQWTNIEEDIWQCRSLEDEQKEKGLLRWIAS